jgi:hypothetical protein
MTQLQFAGRGPAPIERAPEIRPEVIEAILITAASHEQTFLFLKELITPGHLNRPHEAPLRAAWAGMLAAKDVQTHITYEGLAMYVQDYFQSNPHEQALMTSEMYDALFRPDENGLLYAITNSALLVDNSPAGQSNVQLANTMLQRLAQERTVVDQLRDTLNPSKPGVPQLRDVIQDVSDRLNKITASQVLPRVSMSPVFGAPTPPAAVVSPTNCLFIDSRLGGQRVGDVNVLLGPTGGGKSTTALDLAVCCAQQSWVDSNYGERNPAPVIFFSVEEEAVKLRPRIQANWFRIPRAFLEGDINWDTFSTSQNLKPYELDMQAGQPRQLGERERYMLHADACERTMHVLDLSGSDAFPEVGGGYIPELAAYVDRIVSQAGVPPKAIIVDYAGLLVERFMDQKHSDADRALQYGLRRFADTFKKLILSRFPTTAWILQQLKGAAAEYPPTKLLTHADCGACKDFAVNAAAALIIGTADPATGCRFVNFSKTRYVDNSSIRPAIVQIDRQFANIVDVTDAYHCDRMSRQFMPVGASRALGGAERFISN